MQRSKKCCNIQKMVAIDKIVKKFIKITLNL
jgi:hypothetical protein